jgi:endonuclease-3
VPLKKPTKNSKTLIKIPFEDLNCIDVSPDMQVMKVFKRTRFLPKKAKKETLMYYARELNPEYPGVFDNPSWEIGSEWCKLKNPKCDECYLNSYCPKII